MAIRVVFGEDSYLAREGILRALEGEEDIEVVATGRPRCPRRRIEGALTGGSNRLCCPCVGCAVVDVARNCRLAPAGIGGRDRPEPRHLGLDCYGRSGVGRLDREGGHGRRLMAAEARDVLAGFERAGFLPDHRPAEVGERRAAVGQRAVRGDRKLENPY